MKILSDSYVETKYPNLAAAVQQAKDEAREILKDELGDGYNEEDFNQETLEYRQYGDFITSHLHSFDARFLGPTITLHIPTNKVFDAEGEDSDLSQRFLDLYYAEE